MTFDIDLLLKNLASIQFAGCKKHTAATHAAVQRYFTVKALKRK